MKKTAYRKMKGRRADKNVLVGAAKKKPRPRVGKGI